MNIGIDISQIAYTGSGVARFTQGLVNAIIDYDKHNTWYFFFFGLRSSLDKELEKKISDAGHMCIKRPIPPTALSFLHNTIHSSLLSFDSSLIKNLDWFITSDWTEPPLSCRKGTIVHDLVFKLYPETLHPTILKTQIERLTHVSKESSLIFVDSHSTAHDLRKYYPVDSDSIVVNYPGVPQDPVQTDTKLTLEKYSITTPFILTVGKIEPRKNIAALIEAYEQIQTEMPLIIVGSSGWGDMPVPTTSNIKLIGYVSDEELNALYQAAHCFIYPSIYEGFGYPVIEAMMHECPVATSNTSSLVEIGKDAALLFDPHSTDNIAEVMKELIFNDQIRKKCKDNGLKRAGEFTWQRYYTILVQSLNDKLHNNT